MVCIIHSVRTTSWWATGWTTTISTEGFPLSACLKRRYTRPSRERGKEREGRREREGERWRERERGGGAEIAGYPLTSKRYRSESLSSFIHSFVRSFVRSIVSPSANDAYSLMSHNAIRTAKEREKRGCVWWGGGGYTKGVIHRCKGHTRVRSFQHTNVVCAFITEQLDKTPLKD